MSEEVESALLEALRVLTNPEDREVYTVTDIPDSKLLIQVAVLKTLAEITKDDVLAAFVHNLALISRSRKRKGAKEVVDMLRGARARVLQTTVLSGVKRVLVGGRGVEEIE